METSLQFTAGEQHKCVSAGTLGLVKVPGISEISTVKAAGLSI